ncbi:MAG: hypothetical protein ACLTW9_18190 [Enterocloster sp.]
MDLLTGIASASMDIKSTRLMTDMNVAMLGKVPWIRHGNRGRRCSR